MSTSAKYDALPEEYQQLCRETMDSFKRIGDARPDEWDHIVAYYFDEYAAMPAGWFKWWED